MVIQPHFPLGIYNTSDKQLSKPYLSFLPACIVQYSSPGVISKRELYDLVPIWRAKWARRFSICDPDVTLPSLLSLHSEIHRLEQNNDV